MREYPLKNVEEPCLMEDVFPHTIPPCIVFDGKIVEYIDGKRIEFDPQEALRRDLCVTDTTFRDGQQARPPYSVSQQVRLYEMLAQLNGSSNVIRQTEFFLYTKNDRAALDACRSLGYAFPEVTGWIRANKGDFRLVKEAGLKETGVLTSSSDYHIFQKQRQTRQEAFDQYIEVVEAALEAGVRVRCHLEDVTRADVFGFVFPFVQKVMRLAEQVPDDLKPKIRLCDTLGFGVHVPRRRAAAVGAEAGLVHEPRVRRAAGASGVARAQRLPQGADQTPPPPGCTAATRPTARFSAMGSGRATRPWRARSSSCAAIAAARWA
jgi:hypothetical protein